MADTFKEVTNDHKNAKFGGSNSSVLECDAVSLGE
jgi:hypothetical protein